MIFPFEDVRSLYCGNGSVAEWQRCATLVHWCQREKEKGSLLLFEGCNEVHAPGQQQVYLVCKYSMDDFLGHIVWIQDWQQSRPPDEDEKNTAANSIQNFLHSTLQEVIT